MPTSFRDDLTSYREFYGSYHHHKEQLAYAATVLYLGASTWAALEGPSLVGTDTRKLLLSILFAATTISAFAFVAWQLQKRRVAADIVDGCNRLLAGRAEGASAEPKRYAGITLPGTLVDAIHESVEDRAWFRGPRMSEIVTLAAMMAWTVVSFLRIYCQF